jgi:hypothetical protein
MTRTCLICIVALAACGDNAPAHQMPDAAPPMPDAPTGFVEAPHASVPQVQNAGGSVLAAPTVVPIFFMGDGDAQTQIEMFLTQLAASSYWPTTTSEYGVGAITIQASVVTTDTPPTTDAALATWLASKFPTPDPNTIYTVFLPAGAVLTQGNSKSCVAFGGYHSETTANNAPLVYALIPRCMSSTFSGPLDETTIATSHELVEASTDPHPFTAPAFVSLDPAHIIWGRTPGGELGDMCEYVRAAYQPLLGSFMVQRTWSNASAAAGHDPCVPTLGTPYLGAAPNFPDLQITTHSGQMLTTKGITVNLHQSQMVEVDLFTDQPSDDYSVIVEDTNQVNGMPGNFEFFWGKSNGHNGDKLQVLVTRSVAGTGRASEIVFFVQNSTGQSVAEWWGYVAGQ